MPGTQQPPPSRFSRLPDTQNIISFVMSTVDRIADKPTRQRFYNAVFRFSYQRPVVSSFIALQLLFALFPIACFIGFTISTVLFILTTAIGVGMFWVGVAGVFLFWTLVLTFTLAASTWLYLAFCFVTIRWIGRVTGYIESPPPSSTRTQGQKNLNGRPTTTSTTTSKKETQHQPPTQQNGGDATPVKREYQNNNNNESSAILDDLDGEDIIEVLSAEQPADTMRQFHIQQIKDGIRRNSIEKMDAGQRYEFLAGEA